MLPWAKGKYKKEAYCLLETSNPDPSEVKETIDTLNKFSGFIIKDVEVKALINRLMDKLG
jgi:hypothetical protein